jgi:hypothetical protein
MGWKVVMVNKTESSIANKASNPSHAENTSRDHGHSISSDDELAEKFSG